MGSEERAAERCRLDTLAASRSPITHSRYYELHNDDQRLIRGWYRRPRGGDEFEGFIYLWIALNGWAACVSGRDSDIAWRDALSADPELNDQFAQLLASETATAAAARDFAALWPVFRVDELRRLGIDYFVPVDERAAAARRYRDGGGARFEASCLYQHDALPLDWAHTLAVL